MATTKTPITFRLDNELLEMLTRLQKTRGTEFYDRDRTWLIEEALRSKYKPVAEKLSGNGAS